MKLIYCLYVLISIYSNEMITSALSCACNNNSTIGARHRNCINGTCYITISSAFPRCYVSKHEKGCTSKPDCDTEINKGKNANKTLIICCKKNMCNKQISGVDLDSYNKGSVTSINLIVHNREKKPNQNSKIILSIALPCSVALLIVSLLFLVFKIKKRYQKTGQRNRDHMNSLLSIPTTDRQCNVNQEFSTSGSGVGVPLLVKQTISWQISLKELIGNGAFGNVYHGIFNGVQDVAVKILSTNEEESWEHEKDLYLTTALPHANILGFIGADRKDDGVSIQLWLVFEYHRTGSLYDFLHEKTVDLKTMFGMVKCIVAGLDHLHKPIFGVGEKPPIAHRDLKTKNILVKLDGTCCIADFGLSHKHSIISQNQDKRPSAKIGTRRYRGPELLSNTINVNRFDAFRKADMYAFALCVWELCRRTEINNVIEDYELPYCNDVPANPTEDEMRHVVCIQEKRPIFSKHWVHNEVMETMMDIMTECWYPDPLARLPIARVRKRLLDVNIYAEKL